MAELSYLQPKLFTFEHNGFTYEVVACYEYYSEQGGLDFTGNLLITLLTPEGTLQTIIDKSGEDPFEEGGGIDIELYQKIIAALPK